jgi:hypothetical protein
MFWDTVIHHGNYFLKKWHMLHRDLLRYFISHTFYSSILSLRILKLLETFNFWYLIFDKSEWLYLLYLRSTLLRLDFVPLSWRCCNRKTSVFYFIDLILVYFGWLRYKDFLSFGCVHWTEWHSLTHGPWVSVVL